MKRRLLWALGALVVVLVVALAATFRSSPLPLTPLTPFQDPVAEGPAGMALYGIRAGTMQSRAGLAYRGGSLTEERSFAMGGILVRHPRGDLLIDTGFGSRVDEHVRGSPALIRSMTKYTKGTPVAEQLAAAHIDPHRLMGVVLTHAHWDHVSGISDLPGVPIFVPQAELDFIRSGDPNSALIRTFGELPYKVYGFPGGPYLGFESSYDVFADGSVVIVPASGHTPGSVIVFVTLPGGRRYALLGDAVWQREGVEIPAERPWMSRKLIDVDEERARAVIVHLHQLKERFPEMVMVPAHDARVWDGLPKLPT